MVLLLAFSQVAGNIVYNRSLSLYSCNHYPHINFMYCRAVGEDYLTGLPKPHQPHLPVLLKKICVWTV